MITVMTAVTASVMATCAVEDTAFCLNCIDRFLEICSRSCREYYEKGDEKDTSLDGFVDIMPYFFKSVTNLIECIMNATAHVAVDELTDTQLTYFRSICGHLDTALRTAIELNNQISYAVERRKRRERLERRERRERRGG